MGSQTSNGERSMRGNRSGGLIWIGVAGAMLLTGACTMHFQNVATKGTHNDLSENQAADPDIKTKADEEELFPMLENFIKKQIRGS